MQGVATLLENSRKVYCDSLNHTPIFRLRTDVGAEITKNVTVDVGYRYTDYGSFSKTLEDGKLKFDTKAHQILAGVRYSF